MTTTRDILKRVRQVEIRTRRQVTDAMAGAYHSVFRGQGMDFEEVREYAPGDDVRDIDWNVTARMDRPFIKVFREERELTILLIVDLSASGFFGSVERSKRELAAEMAALLAFAAIRNSDKVGLLLFTGEVELFIPPEKGRQHVLRVIREVLFFEPRGRGTNIPDALRYATRLLKRRAITFLLSDFITPETLNWASEPPTPRDPLLQSLSLYNRRHDLVCMQLGDPRETELPNVGIVLVEDAETGQLVEVNTGRRAVRETYARENERRRHAFARSLLQAGIDLLPLQTDQDYVQPLRAFFKHRAGRR